METCHEEIKALGAAEYQQQVDSTEGGSLNKERVEQSDLFAGIIMASDGYGFASIDGTLDDGRNMKVTTADNPTEVKTTLDGDLEHLIRQLVSTFQSIRERTKNDPKD